MQHRRSQIIGLSFFVIGMALLVIGFLVVPHLAVLLVLAIAFAVVGMVIWASAMVRP
jgi:hypothetical protein